MLDITRSECSVINNRVHHFWKGGMNQLLARALNGRRTVRQAIAYMDDAFTGNSRKAFNHQAYETIDGDTTIELQALQMLKDAVRAGYGEDTNLERAFR